MELQNGNAYRVSTNRMFKPKLSTLLFFITLPFYALDQFTKILVLHAIHPDEILPVIPGFFYLVQVHNTGAAFGMLQNQNLFFMAISIVALVAIGILTARRAFRGAATRIGIALLVAGVFGNLTDRIRLGHVVDFLYFILPWYGPWPSFNVADTCISLAAVLFLFDAVRGSATKQP